jgi:hypothetical protein
VTIYFRIDTASDLFGPAEINFNIIPKYKDRDPKRALLLRIIILPITKVTGSLVLELVGWEVEA